MIPRSGAGGDANPFRVDDRLHGVNCPSAGGWARQSRPPRPKSVAGLRRAFLREVLIDAWADGYVALRLDRNGIDYTLTPSGKAWLREFPTDMLSEIPPHAPTTSRSSSRFPELSP